MNLKTICAIGFAALPSGQIAWLVGTEPPGATMPVERAALGAAFFFVFAVVSGLAGYALGMFGEYLFFRIERANAAKVAAGLLLFVVLITPLAAPANGYGRSYGYSYQQTYPTYEAWQWGKYPADHSYFVRWRWVNRGYNSRTWETNGKLYTRDAGGNYVYSRDIADYKPKGDAHYGIEDVRKAIAKVDKQVGALIDLKHDAPDALNPRDLLPLYKDTRDAELASDERKFSMIVESSKASTLKRLDYDAEERRARYALAEKEAFANTAERHIAQLAEAWAAAGGTKAVLDQAQLDIDDPELERDIRVSCLACHGGQQDKGTGVDFKDIASIDWTDVLTTVATGEMPKGGQPWDAQQLGRLKEYAKAHLSGQ